MEMKRTLLAVVLSMAVLLVFQKYLAPPPRTPAPEPKTESAAPAPTPAVEAPAAPARSVAAPAAETGAVPMAEGPAVEATLENRLLKVTVSSRGAAVVGAELAKYRDRAGEGGAPVRLLAAESGLDEVGATRLVSSAPEWARTYRQSEQGADRVVYRWQGPNGIWIEKTYRLEPDRYDLGVTVRVGNGSDATLRDRLGVVMVQDLSAEEDRYAFIGPAYYRDGEYEEVKLKKAKEGVQAKGPLSWAAFVEKYFLVAVLPPEGGGGALTIGAFRGMEKVVEMELDTPPFELAPGATTSYAYRVYLGPKRASTMAPVGSHLSEVVHYGFFDVVAKPLAWVLDAIYGFTGNYGIAIILLTTLIKAVFWPLSARSFRSMQRMKELQPKMQRLKERYGNDKERLNTEVMQLYKTHKVNPLGGCLPMLVQIPFFFALYKILLTSIELRHAPFVFWLQDLSAKDPYYITPLLMGASMFLQQKMTPATAGSEGQMKMMMYGMPVIFTVMFLNFPSGLVIYWLVNNLLSIAQQGMMLRKGAATQSA